MNSKKLYKSYEQTCKIETKSHNDNINFGYSYAIDSIPYIKAFMDSWVNSRDLLLDRLEKHSPEYAYHLDNRLITYSEFKLLISGKIDESDFERSRMYEFLYIDDKVENRIFLNNYTDNERSVDQNYITLLIEQLEKINPALGNLLINTKIPNYIPFSSLKRHSYVLAGSGMGKTTLLKVITYELQRKSQENRNKSIVVIDPHGDYIVEVLQYVMNQGKGLDRIIYLDPDIRGTARQICGKDVFDTDYHFSINPFEGETILERDIPSLTEYISEAFLSIVDSTETFQMEAIIEACVESLIRMPDTSISDLKTFMDDDKNQHLIEFGKSIPNAERADFLANKFASDKRLSSTKSSVAMRLQKILGNQFFKNSFGASSTFNLEDAINEGKVILVNMNKGVMGSSSAIAAGKLIINLIAAYAYRRVHQPKQERKDTVILMDEFQVFMGQNSILEDLFAEARKFTLYGIFANQQVGQNMSSQAKRLVAGNTSIKFVSQNEPESLEWMTKQMKHLSPLQVEELPEYAFYVNDKFNKKAGSFVNRIPDCLLDMTSKYYLNKQQVEDLFKYLVEESGIYRPLEIPTAAPAETVSFSNPFSE